MNTCARSAGVVLLLMLGGCSTTGGDIGGLFPAPKFLKGDIEDSIYTATGRGFSVAVPHKQGSYEYTYLHIDESYGPKDTYVSFGPAAFDQDVYTLDFYPRPPDVPHLEMAKAAPWALKTLQEQLQKGYGAPVNVMEEGDAQVGGHAAHHWKLQLLASRGSQVANIVVEMYLIDADSAAVVVCMQHQVGGQSLGLGAEKFADSVQVPVAAPDKH